MDAAALGGGGGGSQCRHGNEDFALLCHFEMLHFIPVILGSSNSWCHWFHKAGHKLVGLDISTLACRHLILISALNLI